MLPFICWAFVKSSANSAEPITRLSSKQSLEMKPNGSSKLDTKKHIKNSRLWALRCQFETCFWLLGVVHRDSLWLMFCEADPNKRYTQDWSCTYCTCHAIYPSWKSPTRKWTFIIMWNKYKHNIVFIYYHSILQIHFSVYIRFQAAPKRRSALGARARVSIWRCRPTATRPRKHCRRPVSFAVLLEDSWLNRKNKNVLTIENI